MSITEASLRRHLKLDDHDGITSIPNSEIFEQLALMGYHTDSDKLTFQKEQHFPTPHDSPLHVVHSHGSDEGSLTLNDLTNLVTKLSERLGVLEDDLRKTKKTYSSAFTKLILRVKKLEARVRIGKARKELRRSTETEPFIQEVTPTEVIQDQGSAEVSTAGATKGTASEVPVVKEFEREKDKKRQGKSNNDRV
ncbi:hypothetical protein Tco_1005727 [Tanacetum coccineum]|uniref:Uncharacterized protein n=1 Tax=Tanacetum coccineum TaxID=301880 RepID=A0ABQ5FGS6_9ASTR